MVATYSEAFKSKMVQRMLGPSARTATALAIETGLPQPTLSRWLKERTRTSNLGGVSKPKPPHPAVVPSPSSPARRPEDWTGEERLRAVGESASLSGEELGAWLRAKGLHEATLREWREAAVEALGPQRATHAEAKRIRRLEKELQRKDKALAEAAALLVLQKNRPGLRPTS